MITHFSRHTRTLGLEPKLAVLETDVLPLHYVHLAEGKGTAPSG